MVTLINNIQTSTGQLQLYDFNEAKCKAMHYSQKISSVAQHTHHAQWFRLQMVTMYIQERESFCGQITFRVFAEGYVGNS